VKTIIEIILCTLIVGWLAWFFISDFLRRRNTFSEILMKEIERYDMKLISSEIPPPLVSGPFPLGTSPMGAIPWAWQYRRVIYMNPKGEEKVAWARLCFNENKKKPQIDWIPEFSDSDIIN